MLIRVRCYGRNLRTYLKYIASILLAVVYFSFLFRESLNAFEQNKDKKAAVAAGTSNTLAGKTEFKSSANLRKSVLHYRANDLYRYQNAFLSSPATSTPKIVTQPTTLNPVYEYSEEIHSATEKDLQKRSAHLNAACEQYGLQSRYPPNPWEFFISPGHNLVWCNVFKAASTTWMYYFNILGGYDIEYLQRTETQPIELARKRFPRPTTLELLESLPAAISFLFVRDPLERVLSAYRNKLEGGRNHYFKPLGRKIIQKFRRRNGNANTGSSGIRPRSGPTFMEFVHYLIDENAQNKTLDEHWTPVYRFCTPCSVNFTIVGKIETFQRDSEYIIRQAGLESLLLGKLPKKVAKKIGNLSANRNADQSLIEKYFSELDRKTLDDLLNIYRLDFDLFDYDYQKYYDVVQPPIVPYEVFLTTAHAALSSTMTATNTNTNTNTTNTTNSYVEVLTSAKNQNSSTIRTQQHS